MALPEDFNELVAELDYPMFIVTTVAGDERAGCLIGFATQASIRPPRFLVLLSEKNRTFRIAQGAELLAVHFVPAERPDLAELFGGHTADDGFDKFAHTEWRAGPGGVPLLDGCANRFVGRIVERFEGGDHMGFLLEPVSAEHGASMAEFTFHRAKRIEPGHPA